MCREHFNEEKYNIVMRDHSLCRENVTIMCSAMLVGYKLPLNVLTSCCYNITSCVNRYHYEHIIDWHCDYYDDWDRLTELKLKGLI